MQNDNFKKTSEYLYQGYEQNVSSQEEGLWQEEDEGIRVSDSAPFYERYVAICKSMIPCLANLVNIDGKNAVANSEYQSAIRFLLKHEKEINKLRADIKTARNNNKKIIHQ